MIKFEKKARPESDSWYIDTNHEKTKHYLNQMLPGVDTCSTRCADGTVLNLYPLRSGQRQIDSLELQRPSEELHFDSWYVDPTSKDVMCWKTDEMYRKSNPAMNPEVQRKVIGLAMDVREEMAEAATKAKSAKASRKRRKTKVSGRRKPKSPIKPSRPDRHIA